MDHTSSESEGEIIESDVEMTKATTTLPSSKISTSVNRTLREALSPSPPRFRSTSPTNSSRSRSRSRSPVRLQQQSPRGEKRSRAEMYRDERRRDDPRNFKIHYEGRDGEKNMSRRRRNYYDAALDDPDRASSRHLHLSYDDHRSKRHRTRSRSRSRSPPASSRGHRKNGSYQRDSNRNGRSDRYNSFKEDDRRSEFVNGRARSSFSPNTTTQKSFKVAETRPDNVTKRYNLDSGRSSAEKYDPKRFRSPTTLSLNSMSNNRFPLNHGDSISNQTRRSTNAVHSENEAMALNVEDTVGSAAPAAAETLSIEERRKRREAIKAKYRNQETPLLVQALQPNLGGPDLSKTPTTATTPGQERDYAESTSAPTTPAHDSSTQGSPPSVNILDDSELANCNVVNSANDDRNEPSAADYDPSMDMQEDLERTRSHQDSRQNHSVSVVTYDETQLDAPLVPEGTNTDEPPTKKQKKNIDDMFASDDDDEDVDMFAPMPTKESAKSVSAGVSKAKELDQSLLDNWDDPEGYYKIILGELLDGRYHVQANLGKGMFSSVVRAMDNKNRRLVAIKIIRSNETMSKAATKEMEILEVLASADPDDKKHLIRLERSFSHKGHLCMVFENLSINLREVLKKFGRDVGINLKAVRSYAQQIFLGLSLLRKCNILHADLKPDNILVNESRNLLKICDLGSAADASERDITPYLVSRFYRAPEIILGIAPDFAIDMWSIGCTLFELYTGKILFTGRTNNQMLRSIMECRGKVSLKMLKKGEFGAVHFDDSTNSMNFRSVERDKVTARDITRLINFVQKPTRDLKSRLMAVAAASNSSSSGRVQIPEHEMKELNLFADLLDRCLALNPEKRITPLEALKHPFIHRSSSSSTSSSTLASSTNHATAFTTSFSSSVSTGSPATFR